MKRLGLSLTPKSKPTSLNMLIPLVEKSNEETQKQLLAFLLKKFPNSTAETTRGNHDQK